MKTTAYLFITLLKITNLWAQTNLSDYIQVYRNVGSPFIGGNCQMYPSCSRYADLQFSKHGFWVGLVKSSDRLLRCSHDVELYDLSKINGQYKFIDFGDDSLNKQHVDTWEKRTFAYSDYSDQHNFIKYLITNEHYHEALLEINRTIFQKKSSELDAELLVNYFRVLRKLHLQQRIQLDFETLVPQHLKEESSILFEVGLSWLDLENYVQANLYFDKILKKDNPPHPLIQQQTIAYKVYLQAIKSNYKEAIHLTQKLNEPFVQKQKIANQLILEELTKFKPKSKKLATIMGIIPGGGYLYAKHGKSAISSLIINSLMAFATINTFKSNNAGLGILLGITSLGFYVGNISGGRNAVDRYNKNYTDHRIHKLNPNFSL